MFKERNSSYPSLTSQLQNWPSETLLNLPGIWNSRPSFYCPEGRLLNKRIYIVKQKFLALTRRHSLNKVSNNWPFLKPHPWISQLSPNYNSAGSTASKANLIRLCQLRFQCFFFLRYQIILEEILQMIFFTRHTTYSWNNMCQKCEGKSVMWDDCF